MRDEKKHTPKHLTQYPAYSILMHSKTTLYKILTHFGFNGQCHGIAPILNFYILLNLPIRIPDLTLKCLRIWF